MTIDQTRSKSCPVCGMTFTADRKDRRGLVYKVNSHMRKEHRTYSTTRRAWNALIAFGTVAGAVALTFTFITACNRYSGCAPPIVQQGTGSPYFPPALGTYVAILLVGIFLRQHMLRSLKSSWQNAPLIQTQEVQPSPYRSKSDFSGALQTTDFFDDLANRLSQKGFEVQRQIRSDPYSINLYAVGPGIPRGKGGGTIAVMGVEMPTATASGVSAFSSFAMAYIRENKRTLQISTFDLDLLPVIAAEGFSPEVIAWISETRPFQKALTDTFEFPVLVSTKTGEVYCFKKTPFMGGLHYRVLRTWATEHIGFQTQLDAASSQLGQS